MRIMPRIGIYDKVNPQVFVPNGMPDRNGGSGGSGGDAGGGTIPAAESGGLGAGWVIFILLIIFGGLGALYHFKGKEIMEKIKGSGGGTFEAGTV